MITREEFKSIALNFYHWCNYPAVKYKILFHLLDYKYDDRKLMELRNDFLHSDIVMQLYDEQLPDGSWGPLRDKDYSCKSIFPTTFVAIERCLYIGLTIEDKDILFMASEYLEEFLQGKSKTKLYNKNERAIPWQMSEIAFYTERIKPNNPLCDRLWNEWNYIATCAFADGEYSHDRDKRAQHEIFLTREDRLIPIPISLLLTRSKDLLRNLEDAMVNYYGKNAYLNGYFWDKSLDKFPEDFASNKTRRWFHTIKYINQFRNTKDYLSNAMEWLLSNRDLDGLWDYGSQIKDPWGYYGYFSTNRKYKYNNKVDCTMEVLNILKTYIDHNQI
ncbi:hypothetical protein I5677_17010 [Mobilitalea sibirica]|uniref:Uncharacterized protein n=1 Tax=Mobilitalea sibirica TaxID=1462919 RepID=A0A8J7HDW8_9FIRM|nr:hypothetical protein [Mobilitalea sibirica]MBH1942592.1 hypothetical protein [Mobilitalea sibirica]